MKIKDSYFCVEYLNHLEISKVVGVVLLHIKSFLFPVSTHTEEENWEFGPQFDGGEDVVTWVLELRQDVKH